MEVAELLLSWIADEVIAEASDDEWEILQLG